MQGRRRARWIVTIAILAIVAALILAFTAGWVASERRQSKLAAKADVIITDSMLEYRPTYQELKEGPVGVWTCVGGTLSVANASRRTVGLAAIPENSDARVELGIAQPGGVLTFDVGAVGESPGSYYLEDLGGPLLSRYDVVKC